MKETAFSHSILKLFADDFQFIQHQSTATGTFEYITKLTGRTYNGQLILLACIIGLSFQHLKGKFKLRPIGLGGSV